METHQHTIRLGFHSEAHLLGLVEAMLVTVGKIKRSKLVAQSLLRGRDRVQGRVKFSVTWTLQQNIDSKLVIKVNTMHLMETSRKMTAGFKNLSLTLSAGHIRIR